MALETILWTLLPASVSGNTLSFSLVVSPRIGADGTLNDFPYFRDFTTHVAALTSVPIQVVGIAEPFQATVRTDVLRPELWSRVFPPTTLVRAWTPQAQQGTTIQSYSTLALHKQILGLYEKVATTPSLTAAHPSIVGSPLGAFLTALAPIKHLLENSDRDPTNASLDKGAATLPAVAKSFFAAMRFYMRPPGDAGAVIPPPVNDFDFAQVVALLADHGQLLRHLGLVIDLDLAVTTHPIPLQSNMRVGALPIGDAAVRPLTRCAIDGGRFYARPRAGSDVVGGLLQLGDPNRFGVLSVDIDGAALKTTNYAIAAEGERLKTAALIRTQDKPTTTTLPALRSGGFTLVRNKRADAVKSGFAKTDAFHQLGDQAVLYADDVTRGFRLDVLAEGAWHSLCHRVGTLTVGPTGSAVTLPVDSLGAPADEGYVKGASGTKSKKPGAPDELYLHEAITTWRGWSLVAPRPGRSISMPPESIPTHKTNEGIPGFAVAPAYKAKKLPKLRFGESYAFRARAVDLAGNSLPPDETPPGPLPGPPPWMSPIVPYVRYEPVSSPAIVPDRVMRKGESLETLVVRSMVRQSDPPMAPAVFNVRCGRHFAPPKTSQEMAEQHGMLDGYFDDAEGRAYAFRLCCKEQGTLLDRFVVDPNETSFDAAEFPAKLVPVLGIALVDPALDEPILLPTDDSAWPEHPGDPLKDGRYVIHRADDLMLPYLPDPLARGVVFRDGFGSSRSVVYPGQWPDVAPFRLSLVPAATGTFTSPGPGQIEVGLPIGTMAKLRYSSTLTEDAVTTPNGAGKLALGRNLPDPGDALAGNNWMLSPYRELLLVHAVERPVTPPAVVVTQALKVSGDTFASLYGSFTSHSESTGEMDLVGRWTDPVDRLTDPGPVDEDRTGVAFTRKIGYAEATAPFPKQTAGIRVVGAPPRHEFGDTKHRLVHYSPTGRSRYLEYFPKAVSGDPSRNSQVGPEMAKAISILSSARPAAPQVLYAVPTFQWQSTASGLSSTRKASGLRVYLDRPWYSSGAGEALAVVLPMTPLATDAMERVRPYVSVWGADPIENEAPPTVELAAARFSNRVGIFEGVPLAEDSSLFVRLVTFGIPTFDDERKLWFCDIEMNVDNRYFPFVRLAFARFQANSVRDGLEDLRLSNVVMADFMQLTPTRTATLAPTAGMVRVTLTGPLALSQVGEDLASQPHPAAGHTVTAQIQRRLKALPLPGDKTPLDWLPLGDELELPSMPHAVTAVWRRDLPWVNRDTNYDYRVIVREVELYEWDTPPLGYTPPLAERLLHLDILPLVP